MSRTCLSSSSSYSSSSSSSSSSRRCLAATLAAQVDIAAAAAKDSILVTMGRVVRVWGGMQFSVSTFHNDDDFCEALLSVLCSGCLELTAENCR